MSPSRSTVPGWPCCTIGATAGNHPKAPPRGSNAATGGWVGQHYERGCKRHLLAFLPPCDGPGSVRQYRGDSTQTAPRRGRAKLSPKLQPPTIRQAGGTSPPLGVSTESRASEARQAVGNTPVVKGSEGVGMWSTWRVVHHVHAVGALVHQAAQARPLIARFGGFGGAKPGRTWGTRSAPRGLHGFASS